jgi:hypothetical protein
MQKVLKSKEAAKKEKTPDLDKNLKAANKNAVKNSMQVESDDSDDEEGEMDMGDFDLEAEEGEDDLEVDSDEINESGDEDDEVLKKLEAIK